MKELWVNKTIYKRYLIDDDDISLAKSLLKDQQMGDRLSTDQDSAEDVIAFIEDDLNRNQLEEYDGEKVIFPIKFHFMEIEG